MTAHLMFGGKNSEDPYIEACGQRISNRFLADLDRPDISDAPSEGSASPSRRKEWSRTEQSLLKAPPGAAAKYYIQHARSRASVLWGDGASLLFTRKLTISAGRPLPCAYDTLTLGDRRLS